MRAWFENECKARNRSFWAARYYAGDEVWEHECDWSEIPRSGLVEVRLHCPNGQIGVLGNTVGLEERAWQTKTLVATTASRDLIAHSIGVHDQASNTSTVYTWDYNTRTLVGPYNTITPELNFDVVGVA